MKSEREVTQSCLTLSNPMDCILPGFSVHGIFQARILEWGAIAFSLGKFIPRNLILFVAMVNEIDSLISLSDFSLLVYRNASDSCVLILIDSVTVF